MQHSRDTMFLLPLMSKLKKLDCVSKPQNNLSCGHCIPCVWHLGRQGHVLLSACLGSVVPASVCGVGGALISFPMVAVILVTSMFHPGCQWNELLSKISPGNLSVVPYTSSALVQPMSSLSAE